MSVQIDYATIAIIASASGFFGAFGTELAKWLIQLSKDRKKRLTEIIKERNGATS